MNGPGWTRAAGYRCRPQMSAAPALQASPATDAAPAAGENRTPLAFVVDEESSIRHFVSLLLQGQGVDTQEFPDGAALRRARSTRPPDLILLDVNLEVQDALQSIETLGKSGCAAAVQLMSGRGAAVLETVKQAGEAHGLRMLPVLKKPFETQALQKILDELKLGHAPSSAVKIPLADALKNNWIEFWYQPKIDLRKKQLVGAEAFARARHPQHGVLSPASFMPGADDISLQGLAEQALVSAMKSGLNLSRLGVNLRIAVNMTVNALTKVPISDIVRAHRPTVDNWPGLIIDVAEEQIVNEIALANELTKKPFAEMKLDRSFVTGCGTDKVNAPICKTVIDLAHSFGSLAVGIGLEKASDVLALVSMGCDLGQGFLLGQPMPEERFISILKQRATVRQKPQGAAATPQA
jgi:EAL domain-containing protein (putative c-di-GMP-specific phosphodiesterase class I)